MADVVILDRLSEAEAITIDLRKSRTEVACLAGCYQTHGGRIIARPILWNGSQAANKDAKRLMLDHPRLYAAIADRVQGRKPLELIESGRDIAEPHYAVSKHLRTSGREYARLFNWPPYALDVATERDGSPWIKMRFWAPGKRKLRKHYLAWNGERLRGGRDLAALQRDHPVVARFLTEELKRVEPEMLVAWTRYVDSNGELRVVA